MSAGRDRASLCRQLLALAFAPKRWAMRLVLFTLALTSATEIAAAHGGVSIDDDQCKIHVGPYSLHFAGYQPTGTSWEEACWKFSNTGSTIFVLDLIEHELRNKSIVVKLYETEADGETKKSLISTPLRVYKEGFLRFDGTLPEEGKYQVEVTVADASRNEIYTGREGLIVRSATMSFTLVGTMIALGLGGIAIYIYGASRARRVSR